MSFCKLRCSSSFGLSKEFKLVYSLHLVLCSGGWYTLSLLLYWQRSASTDTPGAIKLWYFHGLFWAGWWLQIYVEGQICFSCVPAITFLENESPWKACFLISHLPRTKSFSLCVIFWMSPISQCLALSRRDEDSHRFGEHKSGLIVFPFKCWSGCSAISAAAVEIELELQWCW